MINRDPQTRLSHLARQEIRALKSTLRESERMKLVDALQSAYLPKNIYGYIAGHHNSDRALSLIRQSSVFLYPATAIENLSVSIETWQKKVVVAEFGNDVEDTLRLFWSPLELVMVRARPNEILGIMSYLVGESRGLVNFEMEYWEFSVPEVQKHRA